MASSRSRVAKTHSAEFEDNRKSRMNRMPLLTRLMDGFALAVAPYITGMPGSRRRSSPHVPNPAAPPHLLNFSVVPFALITIAAVAYLLGSIPFGYLLVRIFRGQDIR